MVTLKEEIDRIQDLADRLDKIGLHDRAIYRYKEANKLRELLHHESSD